MVGINVTTLLSRVAYEVVKSAFSQSATANESSDMQDNSYGVAHKHIAYPLQQRLGNPLLLCNNDVCQKVVTIQKSVILSEDMVINGFPFVKGTEVEFYEDGELKSFVPPGVKCIVKKLKGKGIGNITGLGDCSPNPRYYFLPLPISRNK